MLARGGATAKTKQPNELPLWTTSRASWSNSSHARVSKQRIDTTGNSDDDVNNNNNDNQRSRETHHTIRIRRALAILGHKISSRDDLHHKLPSACHDDKPANQTTKHRNQHTCSPFLTYDYSSKSNFKDFQNLSTKLRKTLQSSIMFGRELKAEGKKGSSGDV